MPDHTHLNETEAKPAQPKRPRLPPILPPDQWQMAQQIAKQLLFIGLIIAFVLFFKRFGDDMPYAWATRQMQATLDAQAQHYQVTIEALLATIEAPPE